MLALSRRLRFTTLITVSSLLVAFGGCGDDDDGTGVTPPPPNTFQMGGGLQGEALSLTTVVTTLAGGGPGSSNGTGTAAKFLHPSFVTTDGTRLYVADSVNQTIRQIVIATGEVTTLAGSAGAAGSVDGTGSAARFRNPLGITTDGTHLWVSDSENSTIRQIVIATGLVTTLAGSAGLNGSDDGTGPAARFNNPHGITTDGSDLYVADRFNSSVRRIDIATQAVTTLAGGISGGLLGITTDGTNLYVTTDSAVQQVVVATGIVTTVAGDLSSTGSADGLGSVARFYNPWAITTDGTSLYVADTANSTIREIVIATGAVTTLAGTAGVGGTADGTGNAAQFGSPRGITTDGDRLYVVDYYGCLCARQID